MTVRRLFFATTATAAAVVVLALCMAGKWANEAHEAFIHAEQIRSDVYTAF